MLRQLLLASALAGTLVAAGPVLAAGSTWDELSATLFADRVLLDAGDRIAIDSPYRTADDARTRIAAKVSAPPGMLLGRVLVILDENPVPVSAVVAFTEPLPHFSFDVTLRVNGPTPLHIVTETTDGQLHVADSFVKTSGQGACAAPPGSDPAMALDTLGDMRLALAPLEAGGNSLRERIAGLSGPLNRLDIDIDHPSHSGMQMDQISLLYIPMRHVDSLRVDLDGSGYAEVTGSISLSENPSLSLSVPGTAQSAEVTLTDSDGTVTRAVTTLPGY